MEFVLEYLNMVQYLLFLLWKVVLLLFGEQIAEIVWDFKFLWHIVTWFLYLEERLILLWFGLKWSKWKILALISVVNLIMIGVETLIFIGLRKTKRFGRIKTPQFLIKMSKGKPIGFFGLALFGLTPHCQKFGTLAFASRIKRYGFRGFLALAIGSTCRLAIYILLGETIIWVVIAVTLLLRSLDLLFSFNKLLT